MNNLPNGGKVVIVDDQFREILPLINILNKNAIPVIYYSGDIKELPEKPLEGIRLFFLDLRFSTNTDPKTIVSNACNMLQKILSEDNGPYLLIVWSSTGNDYKENLEQALENKAYRPEFILCLSKANYFETKTSEIYDVLDDVKKILEEADVENVDSIMGKICDRIIANEDESEKVFIPSSIGELQQELYDGLKKAGLLSLFILWENTIRNSAHKVVNEIFTQIPETISVDKKLPAMIYYLAKNRLEKQFELVGEGDKLHAALMELNELYTYFYSEDVFNISVDTFLPVNIQRNNDLVPSQAKFNTWKMISPSYKKDAPGTIYEDKNKIFEFFNLAKAYTNENEYRDVTQKLKEDEQIQYIGININGECETAQNKYPVIRIMPGVLIPCEVYKKYKEDGVLKEKEKAGNYIFGDLDVVEYNEIEYYLLFNINQITFWDKNVLGNVDVYFTLHRKYYLKLRQALVADFSKQGLDLYGGH